LRRYSATSAVRDGSAIKAHGEPLGPDNTRKTKERLGWPPEPAFYVPDDLLAFYRDLGKKGADLEAQWKTTYLQWKKENPELAEQFKRIERGELPRSLPWPQFTPENGAVATRDSGGATMNAIAASTRAGRPISS